MRPLVVGQAPSDRSLRGTALGPETASGRRLRALGLRDFDAVNLRGVHPGLRPKPLGGKHSSPGEAFGGPSRRGLALVRRMMMIGRGLVILLGRAVARALGYQRLGFFEVAFTADGLLGVFPHPSGTSHWWNDPGNAARWAIEARRFLSMAGHAP